MHDNGVMFTVGETVVAEKFSPYKELALPAQHASKADVTKSM